MFATKPLSLIIQHIARSVATGALNACLDTSDTRALVPWDRLTVFLWMLALDDKYEWTALVIVTFLSVSLKRIRNSLSVIIVMSKLHKKSIYPFLDFYQKHRWDIIHWPRPLLAADLIKHSKLEHKRPFEFPRSGTGRHWHWPVLSLQSLRWKSRQALNWPLGR